MGFLSNIFGGNRRPIQTREEVRVKMPSEASSDLTRKLREVADLGFRAARGEQNVPGIGFGPDFVSKATNPVIKDRLRRLREEEIPTIVNAATARGINRSNITTNQIARQSRLAQGDIDQLLANFYILNKQQEKVDTTQGLNIGQNQQTLDIDQSNQQVNQAVRELSRQNADIQQRNERSKETNQQLLSLGGGAVSGGINPNTGKIDILRAITGASGGLSSSPRARTIQNTSDQDVDNLSREEAIALLRQARGY